MALHKLTVNDFYDDDYKLIAIHCNLEDYRMAYLLNQTLSVKLKRTEQDLDFKYLTASYSLFEWDNDTQKLKWNLVSNTCKKEEEHIYSSGTLFSTSQNTLRTFHLVPEYKNVDYFIKISNNSNQLSHKPILDKLQAVPQIVTSYLVNTDKLKSREHLIF